MICVTHDQAEAMSMADHVVVMRDGRIEQAGPPAAIYERPATTFVAGFLGAPPMNLMPLDRLPGGGATDRSIIAGIRPEALTLSGQGSSLPMVVTHREYLGGDTVLTGLLAGTDTILQARVTGAVAASAGDTPLLWFAPEAIHLFDAATGQRLNETGRESTQ